MRPVSARRGFTLIEMAVVLVVLGLVTGVLVMPLAARIEAGQRRAADNMLDDIVDALTGFVLIHGRLPCPSIEADPGNPAYGLEQGPPCPATPGYLPWRTLGLTATDPWGQARARSGDAWTGHWRYLPDRNFTDGAISIATLPSGLIQVRDHDGNPLTTVSSRTVAVIFSTGPNRRADGINATFSPTSPRFETGEPTPAFDDLVRWIGHPLLIARLARGGRL
jgi:prepilin-type N-terminal cleavage/methylation domain-containing protein